MLAAWKAEVMAANWVWMVGLSVAMMGAWAEKMVERKASMGAHWVVLSVSSMECEKACRRAGMMADQWVAAKAASTDGTKEKSLVSSMADQLDMTMALSMGGWMVESLADQWAQIEAEHWVDQLA